MTSFLGSALVGFMLLVAACAKAWRPLALRELIQKILTVSSGAANFLVFTILATESSLGALLICQWQSQWVIPAAFILFSLLTGVSFYLAKKELIENCNCYGSFMKVSPKQNMRINALYLLILALSYSELSEPSVTPYWPLYLAAVLTTALVLIAARKLKNN
ncbi:MAG: hypothetical protein HQL32_13470 [Planctomycetes bacterium]|nr:hypothetical protein [Planctomycetota bacterium]